MWEAVPSSESPSRDDPTKSVTNANARFHFSPNTYAAGPALHPTVGSPNPMLTGVALARRLGDHLVPPPVPFAPEAGFTSLFDGFDMSKWSMSKITNQPPEKSNPGSFIVVDGSLESTPGNDLGLLWHTDPMPANYVLRLQWLRLDDHGNTGVFVRFPNPNSKGYNNTAQGERILNVQNLEHVAFIPSSFEPFALDTKLTTALLLQQIDGHVPQCGQVFRRMTSACSTRIFTKSHIQDPVQRVLHLPMPTHCAQRSLGIGW
jgi:hypothetical protein